MRFHDIPTNLIIGFLGVGKTTAIAHLLSQRPPEQRWAVLVNEFGQVGVDGALLERDGVYIREVPGGCLCCAASQSLQVGLNRLIREARPQRILIEPTGLGHPARLIDSLTGASFRRVLDLRATLCLVDATQLGDPRYAQNETFRDQIQLADVLVANKTDTYGQSDTERFLDTAGASAAPRAKVAMVEQGRVAREWLDLPRLSGRQALYPQAHAHADEAAQSCAAPDPGGWLLVEGAAEGYYSASWRMHARHVFDEDAVRGLLAELPAERVKAVLHTGAGSLTANCSGARCTFGHGPPAPESRLELVHSEPLDWAHVDRRLRRLTR